MVTWLLSPISHLAGQCIPVWCPPGYLALYSLYVLTSVALHTMAAFLFGDCISVADQNDWHALNARMIGTPLLGIH